MCFFIAGTEKGAAVMSLRTFVCSSDFRVRSLKNGWPLSFGLFLSSSTSQKKPKSNIFHQKNWEVLMKIEGIQVISLLDGSFWSFPKTAGSVCEVMVFHFFSEPKISQPYNVHAFLKGLVLQKLTRDLCFPACSLKIASYTLRVTGLGFWSKGS